MFNSIIIPVPYISAFEVYPFADNSTINIIISGSYEPIPAAFESFDEYTVGFQQFFSGSGFWASSGQVYAPYVYMFDKFQYYQTGTNFTGAALTGQVLSTGYILTTGARIGYISLSGNY